MSDDKLKCDNSDLFLYPEHRMKQNAITRIRLGHGVPEYAVDDLTFDEIADRLSHRGVRIRSHGKGDTRRVWIDYQMGVTTIRIHPGANHLPVNHVETRETCGRHP